MSTKKENREAFPLDWNEWRAQWRDWRDAKMKRFPRSTYDFGEPSVAASDVLGKWSVTTIGAAVELSEVVMPDFGSDSMTAKTRHVGVTFGEASGRRTDLVSSFAELEQALGLREAEQS